MQSIVLNMICEALVELAGLNLVDEAGEVEYGRKERKRELSNCVTAPALSHTAH